VHVYVETIKYLWARVHEVDAHRIDLVCDHRNKKALQLLIVKALCRALSEASVNPIRVVGLPFANLSQLVDDLV
jgi:ABC-type enterochelin transport system permease subunit